MANSKQKKSWKLSKKNNNMAYGLGAAIVIVGALMKITHIPYCGKRKSTKRDLAIRWDCKKSVLHITKFRKEGVEF